jgi:hypothetical protein
MRRSAQHLRRADVRHGAGQALAGDELAAAELALTLRREPRPPGAQGGSARRHLSRP